MDGTAPLISVELRHVEGALGRPDPNAGVLSHLDAAYVVYAVGVPMGPDAATAIGERLGELRTASEPWLSRTRYSNFAEREVDPSTFFPEGVYGRLSEIRAELDPDGLFRARHTIA
jgi:hypothetical protein